MKKMCFALSIILAVVVAFGGCSQNQKIYAGGNLYNADGKIVDNINSEGLTISFEKSLAELLALKHQADGSIYPNGSIFKAKLAEGGSFNIYWYIQKINLWHSSAMLTPMEVIDSVVVHELAHKREMNHSARFYNEILKVFPDYHIWDKWLKENGNSIMKRMIF